MSAFTACAVFGSRRTSGHGGSPFTGESDPQSAFSIPQAPRLKGPPLGVNQAGACGRSLSTSCHHSQRRPAAPPTEFHSGASTHPPGSFRHGDAAPGSPTRGGDSMHGLRAARHGGWASAGRYPRPLAELYGEPHLPASGRSRCRKVSPLRSYSLPRVHAPSKTLSRCVRISRPCERTVELQELISVNHTRPGP